MTIVEEKGMGCWAKGCIALLILGAIISGIIGLGIYSLYQKAFKFTATQSLQLPIQEVSSQQYDEIQHRIEAFRKALLEEDTQSTLELSADEINALITMNPKWADARGKFHLQLDGDEAFARISIPLSKIPGFNGRYLNASAHLRPSVENGRLKLFLTSLEVNGKQVPPALLEKNREKIQQLIWQEIAKKDPDLAFLIARIKRLEIQDNKMILGGGSKPPPSTSPLQEQVPSASLPTPPPRETTSAAPSSQPTVIPEKTTNPDLNSETNVSEPSSQIGSSTEKESEGKYIGKTLQDVKKQLGDPIMTSEEGNTTTLFFPTVEIYSTNGVTVTDEKIISP